MAGIMPITPYIGSKPEYAALSGQTSTPFQLQRDVEYGEFVLEIDGQPSTRSGLIEANTLMTRGFVARYPLILKRKVRFYFIFTYVKNGYTRSVTVPLNLPKKRHHRKTGVPILEIPPDNPAYPSPVRKARRRASSRNNSRRAARLSVPHRRTPRPNPEIYSRPFRRILENQDEDPPYAYHVDSDTVDPIASFTRTWSGSNTPNYGKTRKHALPVNPHSVVIKEVKLNQVLHGSRNNAAPGYNSWVRLFTEKYAEPPVPDHHSLARFNALRRLIDAAELGVEANLAQDLAQMRQTFGLVTSTANRIYRSVRSLKKGDIPSAVRELTHGQRPNGKIKIGKPSPTKTVAENWLELQYGWKPLLQDIEGTFKSMSVLHANDFVQRVAVSAKSENETVSTTPSQYDSALFKPGLAITHKVRVNTRCKFVLRFRIASPLRSFMAQTGFTNPINLAWEILPFSFVVDWFIPIGSYLESFHSFDGLEFVDGSQTLFTKGLTDSAVDFEGIVLGNHTMSFWEHARYRSETVRLDRTKLTAFPTQTFPSFKNGLASVTHAANAIALVKSIFSQ